MTDEELKEIEARAKVSTWPLILDGVGLLPARVERMFLVYGDHCLPMEMPPPTRYFCSQAHSDVPALVAEVRKLRAELAEIRARMADSISARTI